MGMCAAPNSKHGGSVKKSKAKLTGRKGGPFEHRSGKVETKHLEAKKRPAKKSQKGC